jgi:hypothetical protein
MDAVFHNSPIKQEAIFFPPTEVHSFYQDVFITDMKREIEVAHEEKNQQRREAVDL